MHNRECSSKAFLLENNSYIWKEYCNVCYQCLKRNKCGSLVNNCKSLLRTDFFWISKPLPLACYMSYSSLHVNLSIENGIRQKFCCARDKMGVSAGLGLTKTEKCLTDENFLDQIQFICPYNSIFNRKVSKFSIISVGWNSVIKTSTKKMPCLTLIRESSKKSKTRDHNRARSLEKIQSAALNHFVYGPMLWNFFPESALGDGPKKWHIFLFRTAYFRVYWRMPI